MHSNFEGQIFSTIGLIFLTLTERVTLKFQIELPLLRYCSEKYIKFGVALHKFETSIQNSAADNTCRVLGLLGVDYKRSGAQCPDT